MKILIQNRQRHRSLDRRLIKEKAGQILTLLDRTEAELSLLFVGERRMRKLNHQYRGIDRSTDVLSFEGSIPVKGVPRVVLGDVVVNVQRAETQAIESGIDFYEEIWRLLIHGILHLVGYVHEGSQAEAKLMMDKEREILHAIEEVDR